MTKKTFILIAETVSKIASPEVRREVAEHHAAMCAKANPRFDKGRFMTACGVK